MPGDSNTNNTGPSGPAGGNNQNSTSGSRPSTTQRNDGPKDPPKKDK